MIFNSETSPVWCGEVSISNYGRTIESNGILFNRYRRIIEETQLICGESLKIPKLSDKIEIHCEIVGGNRIKLDDEMNKLAEIMLEESYQLCKQK